MSTYIHLLLMQDDFKPVYDKMIMKMLHKIEKYGLSYRYNDDVSYYLKRLKQEIEEFEKNPCLDESVDIANFAAMIVYHQIKKEAED